MRQVLHVDRAGAGLKVVGKLKSRMHVQSLIQDSSSVNGQAFPALCPFILIASSIGMRFDRFKYQAEWIMYQ